MRCVRPLVGLTAAALALGISPACKKPQAKPEPAKVEPPAPVVEPKAPVETKTDDAAEAARRAEAEKLAAYRTAAEAALKNINFDFDKSDIREADKPKLQGIADFLKNYAQAKVQIAGHCDERGTIEYNLALGERRSLAVRAAMISAGIDGARVQTRSYGEERPVAFGHDESSWQLNRRAEFVVTQM